MCSYSSDAAKTRSPSRCRRRPDRRRAMMRVLALESSCDDTAAAVLDESGVRASVVASQDLVHCQFGGVVPELASRQHVLSIVPVIERALADAGIGLDDVEGVAATYAP